MKKRESLGIYLILFLIVAAVASFSGCAGIQAQKKDKESLLLEAGFHIEAAGFQSGQPLFQSVNSEPATKT
jgi:hypothetical protein